MQRSILLYVLHLSQTPLGMPERQKLIIGTYLLLVECIHRVMCGRLNIISLIVF